MINRILIRIKVIQLLYSTLISENRFTLESVPSSPTKEKRFAYKLYLDTLFLFSKISDSLYNNKNAENLKNTRLILKLQTDDDVKQIFHGTSDNDFINDKLINHFSDKIKQSDLYKIYIKGKDASADHIWEKLFIKEIMPDSVFREAFSNLPNYSIRGVERMQEMMMETFRTLYATSNDINESLRLLELSLKKARELYFRLLLLPVELTYLREQQLDENRHKFLPDQSDSFTSTRFIDNELVNLLKQNENIKESEINFYNNEKIKVSWLMEDRNLMENLLKEIMESDIYKQYMGLPSTDLKTDAEFWRKILSKVIFESEYFLDYLETNSVFWNDDLDIMGTFALKTIKKFEETSGKVPELLPMYKDRQASEFGKDLFSYVLKNEDYLKEIINKVIKTDKWSAERLAFLDVVILMTATAEILRFPEIPVQVTVNEYIEIAKSYSTQKSGGFINGMIGSIIDSLREDNKIEK